jgi:uncharacterized protein (DUF608 family)
MKHIISLLAAVIFILYACNKPDEKGSIHQFNGDYKADNINRIAFPLGGLGAGMICLEGTGRLSQISVRHKAEVFNEPFTMAAIAVKGVKNGAKILEGPVQAYKIYGNPGTGNGAAGQPYGFPHFSESVFQARFPFATVKLKDTDIPMDVEINGWSPFTPGDADNSSLPVAGLEYTFRNTSGSPIEAVFSFHSENFMRINSPDNGNAQSVRKIKNGFVLSQKCTPQKPYYKGDFAIYTNEDAVVDYRWFRGGWFDGRSKMWKDLESLTLPADTATTESTAASLYVPFQLKPGEAKTVHLMMAWYVPHSNIRVGALKGTIATPVCSAESGCCSPEYNSQFYEPWYSGKYKDIYEIADFWKKNYSELKEKSNLFSHTFFSSNLPDEVLEAVSANLSILKSPTVFRQKDGRLWGYEGCGDSQGGCCHGSCTHVWNYAQAIPHLFPKLERTLRETEFTASQDTSGHQNFRSALPIQTTDHTWHAAADGQLGGIMKVYREWIISGNTEWMKQLWPQVKKSYTYCSNLWDPKQKGILEEPHHNTYDIEFWGPDAMCTGIYLGATQAMIIMGKAMGESTSGYENLLDKGRKYMETELYNGKYFYQKVIWEGLKTPSPIENNTVAWNVNYSPEALELLKKEGPKYQYGKGCLSDGVIGSWISNVCGLPGFLDEKMVHNHLNSIYANNFKTDLSDHVNPQRPSYDCGKEGGLLLCTWPEGGEPSLPFVYSNEVWTGIEYQVAAHLMMNGEVDKGLAIVREARKRYDGRIRNPFDEYECGHWYARAMSSYSLLLGLTGIFYDALHKTLHIDSKIGNDFKCFISTESGYGLAGLKNGEPFIDVKNGQVEVNTCLVSGKPMKLVKVNMD